MREKNGEYIALSWDGPPPREYVRGHVGPEGFRRALKSFGVPETGLGPLRHGYARWIPRRGRDYDLEIKDCKKGHGAFKVTTRDVG